MSRHGRSITVFVLLTALVLGAFSLTFLTAAQESPHNCQFGFEATIRQGPSAGLTLTGNLQLDIDMTGSTSGTFILEDGSEIPVAGQIIGRAVNLIFSAGETKYIFGVGTALNDVTGEDCGAVLGGPFVGPEPGDSGDWVTLCVCDLAEMGGKSP